MLDTVTAACAQIPRPAQGQLRVPMQQLYDTCLLKQHPAAQPAAARQAQQSAYGFS